MPADEAEHDGKVPGTLLGTLAVTGRITRDQCQADLLGAPDPWRFEVRLSRFQGDLYWLNGREAIVGELDEKAETFYFSTRVDVPLTPEARGAPGCVVSRVDHAEGTLKLHADGESVHGLSGSLEFVYDTKPGRECYEIIGVPGGFGTLPCALSYRIVGTPIDSSE